MVYAGGLDFGTSGARITVIDAARTVVCQAQVPYSTSPETTSPEIAWEEVWLSALDQLFRNIPDTVRWQLRAIAINGTSATVLLCDASGKPVTAPLLYNDDCGKSHRASLEPLAPPGSPVLSATSSLVKLLWWQATLPSATFQSACFLMHQADWLAFQLHGRPGLSDYHNALKLGYDVGVLTYPDWLLNLGFSRLLPAVQAPGTVLDQVSLAARRRYHLPSDCWVIAGTTDSIAAFLASGARAPGDAVTSLGSTLVIKLLSQTRVDEPHYGIYSHRLGDCWLVGGASNSGGKVLQQFFTADELRELSLKIPKNQPSGLDYYPLSKPGERFPISDPAWLPRISPRPATPEKFLHGLLEGIARIEVEGYQKLESLGASPLKRIFSAGGGAKNPTWAAIRQRFLPVPMETTLSTESSFGTALLALGGWQTFTKAGDVEEGEAH